MADDSPKPGEPKIIVDEDWKAQVEAERAKLAESEAQSAEINSTAATSSANDATQTAREAAASAQYAEARDSERPTTTPGGQPLPPPTLSSLVIALASQAMACLGLAPGPDGNPPPVDRQHASYLIDTLAMLDDKTASHRTQEETDLLSDILHQLRMAFVTLRDRT
jgi:hypothetical protein